MLYVGIIRGGVFMDNNDIFSHSAPENNENENGNENKEEPIELVTPVVTPSEPSGIDSDIFMYIAVALVALGGIVYLIVSKVRSRDEEEGIQEGPCRDEAPLHRLPRGRGALLPC